MSRAQILSEQAANVILVGGPTASGKTELAIRLARDFRGELVGVDSVQVYRQCNIGSAKASAAELKGIKHHMLDLRDVDQDYDVAQFLQDANDAIESIQAAGRTSILCGGTTLYITCLLHGLAALPERSQELRGELNLLSRDELFSMLKTLDPVRAEKLHPNDRLRIIRAIESCRLTGQNSSQALQQHSYRSLHYQGLIIVPYWPRHKLYGRINMRSQAMVDDGLIEETREIIESFGVDLKVLKTVGYAQVRDYLGGRLAKSELVGEIAKFTRRLAKRQMTYWRNEPIKRGWLSRPQAGENSLLIGGEGPLGRTERRLKGVEVYDFSYNALVGRIKERLNLPLDGIELWYLNAESLG